MAAPDGPAFLYTPREISKWVVSACSRLPVFHCVAENEHSSPSLYFLFGGRSLNTGESGHRNGNMAYAGGMLCMASHSKDVGSEGGDSPKRVNKMPVHSSWYPRLSMRLRLLHTLPSKHWCVSCRLGGPCRWHASKNGSRNSHILSGAVPF